MNVTYIPSSNTATNGVALGADSNRDVIVHKILVGLPVDGGAIVVSTITNPLNGATTNLAAKLVQPTAASGKDWFRMYDFGPAGLPLNQGGNVTIDQTMNVSVIWDYLDQVDQ